MSTEMLQLEPWFSPGTPVNTAAWATSSDGWQVPVRGFLKAPRVIPCAVRWRSTGLHVLNIWPVGGIWSLAHSVASHPQHLLQT